MTDFTENLSSGSGRGRPGQASNEAGNFFAPYFDVSIYSAAAEERIKAEESSTGTASFIERLTTKSPVALEQRRAAEAAEAVKSFATGDDFFSGAVRLRTHEGKFLKFSPADGAEELWKIRSHLLIEAPGAGAYKATVTLQPTYEMALKLLDNPVMQYGSLMLVEWGYMGATDSDGRRLRDRGMFNIVQPSARFGKQITIQIVGWDMLSSASRSEQVRIVWKREGEFVRDIGIVKFLLKKYGLTLVDKTRETKRVYELTKSLLTGSESTAGTGVASSIWKKKKPPLVQTWNDWSFLRWLIATNDAIFVMGEDGKTGEVSIYDIADRATQPPKYRLLWYQQPEKPNDIPMIEFDANSLPSLFGQEGSRGWFHSYTDNNTKKDVQKKDVASQSSSGAAGTNKSQATDRVPTAIVRTPEGDKVVYKEIKRNDMRRGGGTMIYPGEEPNVQERGKRLVDVTARVANTHADATVPGIPGIVPLTNVEISHKALGVFGGNYRVMHVTHDVGQGYTTRLKLFRSASTGNKRDPLHKSTKRKSGTKPADGRQDPENPIKGEDSSPNPRGGA